MEKQKAESNELLGNAPDYKGDGVCVWINQDRNGKVYLSIQILGKHGLKLVAFKNEPREKPKEEQS